MKIDYSPIEGHISHWNANIPIEVYVVTCSRLPIITLVVSKSPSKVVFASLTVEILGVWNVPGKTLIMNRHFPVNDSTPIYYLQTLGQHMGFTIDADENEQVKRVMIQMAKAMGYDDDLMFVEVFTGISV